MMARRSIKEHIDEILEAYGQQSRLLGLLAFVSALLVVNVALMVSQVGLTKNTPTTVLDCHYSGNAAHTHNSDCYDASGSLVCPLEARELHTHDDSCYTEQRKLICEQEESEEHTHTDECYEVTYELTCGKEELTEEHVHGPGCFITVNTNAQSTETAPTATTDVLVPKPAQSFTEDLMGYDEDGEEQVVLTVLVDAPEGAFPEGTTMQVKPVEADVEDRVSSAVRDNYSDEDVTVTQVTAVDITFFDADGNEIEPAREIDVKIVSDAIRDAKDPVVVHVDQEKAEVIKNTARVNRDDDDWTVGNENALSFTSERFSPYVVVTVDRDDKGGGNAKTPTDEGSEGRSTTIVPEGGGKPVPAQTFTGEVNGVSVVAKAPEGAFLLDTEMRVSAVENPQVEDAVVSAVDGMVEQVAAVGISFVDADGNVVEPQLPIEVTMTNENAPTDGDSVVVHVDDEGEASVVHQTMITSGNDRVHFDAEDAAIYAMVVTCLEQTLTASDGNTYQITATYDESAGIPRNATLDVHEIIERTAGTDYTDYVAQTEEALGYDAGTLTYVRLFDINILDEEGHKLQPADGSSVSVDIRLYDRRNDVEPQVVHFADNARNAEVLEVQATGNTVSFEASGFSVYAIVEAPEPALIEGGAVTTLDDLAQRPEEGFLLSYNSGGIKYFSSSLNNKDCLIEVKEPSQAAKWYFEPVSGKQNQYYLYTNIDGKKRYLKNTSGNLVGFADAGTPLVLSEASGGAFYLKSASENKWLQHSNGGGGIRFYTDKNNAANSSIYIAPASAFILPRDPYDLDGKSYGIAYNDESATAAALTTERMTSGSAQRLEGEDLLIRPDVLDNTGLLLVANNSDLIEWTFHCVREDAYYITVFMDGTEHYLTLEGVSLKLADGPQGDKSVFTALPGTGEQSGKWRFVVNGYALNLFSKAENGFGGSTASDATTWMNLVERSVLNDEDFNLYTARKVSVSDTKNVTDGKQVVIYTRIWNDTAKRYEFYTVDHDGTLARCYDVGDGVEWIGSTVNTALWEFTEYYETDGKPNNFYELRNVQYGKYIAPQVTGGQVLSNKKIGINLNGRRYGENFTTIIAWDESNYAYAGLKCENGRVVACPLSEADDFYFAKVTPVVQENELTTVDTIDNGRFGITMKMMDFDDGKPNTNNHRNAQQTALLGNGTDTAGLVSSDLKFDGYPVTNASKTGKASASLNTLFNNMQDVNHLFVESIYNESGYFEFNSTQNYAFLNGSDFTVYDQLGTIDPKAGARSPWHGQFLPYNTLIDPDTGEPWPYSTTYTNQTSTLNQELPDTDPRKGEGLHEIPYPLINYFFGMEMEASFTQTASGLDAWGHDIIFEFSGDDDFWLYVDGELVLDLGGIHSAMTGTINFRTGNITSSRGNSTLYEAFRANYLGRGMSESEAKAKLDQIFVVNADGNYVFSDYSNHTMKMFYMERGAGASNLHMRFNLAAVKPGTFVLSKALSGVEDKTNKLLEFPYQIYYTLKDDGESVLHRLSEKTGDAYNAKYVDSSTGVKYAESFTPAGGNESYQDVFFLKPGQSAEVTLPDGVANYYVVECAVNPDIYDHVTVNGEDLVGAGTSNGNRLDFATSRASLSERSQVDFDNHVREGAMRTLTITKRLYAEDGTTRLHYADDNPDLVDTTTFDFRLYLGNENVANEAIPAADMYTYHVKDPKDNYCKWDAENQCFVSLGTTGYAALTSDEKELASFTTSMNGSITKIPADYTVEVRDLIIDSKFKVEERESEIPKGYTLRLGDGYTRMDTNPKIKQYNPISGVIEKNSDPEIQVRNQKGWGLTAEKNWTDADFMAEHDSIYLAVFLPDGKDGLSLLENTVRELKAPETSVYYFFDTLDSGRTFADYQVREVVLTGENITVAQNGTVSGYESITPIEEDGTLTVGGTPAGGKHQDGYVYKVGYETGVQTERNENVRVDTVTNSRPGIRLYKQDWDGENLAGATFTLVDADGNDVAAPSYTSRDDGLITTAYLSAGTYTLTETATPQGFVVLDSPIEITMDEDGTVTVSGVDESYVQVNEDDGDMAATVIIKNRPTGLKIKKIDASTGIPIAGVHFALYRQVSTVNRAVRKDFFPIPGYEDLVTNESGVLSELTMELDPGTYYLTETQAAEGFDLLGEDLCFTLGEDGTVTVNGAGQESWMLPPEQDAESGKVSYIITVPNAGLRKAAIKKVCMGSSTVLSGATFALYRAEDFDDKAEVPLEGAQALLRETTGEDGLIDLGSLVVDCQYRLVEVKAPEGFMQLEHPIKIFVNSDKMRATTGNNDLDIVDLGTKDEPLWQLEVWNNPGVLLPHTGGPGTWGLTITGCVLLCVGAVSLLRRRRA